MSVPTNWDLAGQGIQDEIDALGPLASGASTSLSSIPAADIDGKFVRLIIAGISGSANVKLYANGNQIFNYGTPGSGSTFCIELVFTWNSTNRDLYPQNYVSGFPTNLTSFNPATFTFSTDAIHTVTSFAVVAL